MRYLSLSWKMLLLMLSMLLVLLVWFTSLSLLHMNEQFKRQQAQRKIQGQQYFQYYNQSVEQQLFSWMQSYAELQQLNRQPDFSHFAAALPQQIELLQFNFSVQQLTLLGPDQQPLYQHGAALPIDHLAMAQRTLAAQSPQSVIWCDIQCYKVLGLPLLNAQGDVAVLLMVTELSEVLYNIHQTLGTEVALFSADKAAGGEQQVRLLQTSDKALMQAIYQQLPLDFDIGAASIDGLIIDVTQYSYYLHLIPLAPEDSKAHYLLMVENVSAEMQDKQHYQRKIVWVAVACFIGMLLLILLISRRITSRILRLANALPLLAQRRYQEFRQSSQLKPGLLQDELSTFNQSVLTLSYQLEDLDQQLADNTARLQQMAMFDQLTGLANRNLLQYQLQQALSALVTHPGYVGLLFLDLDKFKNINNSRTHAVGDQLLLQTANRLQSLVAAADIVCRFGGDEFAIVLPHITGHEQAELMASQVLAAFGEPFQLEQAAVSLSASIGLSLTSNAELSPEELIRRADLAMYQAKNNGRNCYYAFNEQMSSDLATRLQLEAELRRALELQQFRLFLQPQVDLRSGHLAGFEALLRWQHPERGLVPPDEFISVLEQAQLIVDVGYWVFERCCQLSIELNTLGLNNTVIALNLAADQFLQPELPQRFQQLLQQYQLRGEQFELELTESTLVSHVGQTLDVMHQLKALGFAFAIDDFGTGYSSLNYLKRMPVDTIKIDKTFVLGMLDNSSDYQIIVSTIAMVHKLGLQVVAEGVEAQQHLQMLQQHHCDMVQGYYFSRPLAPAQLIEFVRDEVLQQNWPARLLSCSNKD
ncbi:putative bifunctional diguanylate cyclase/phosphodiesterase [Rheinheimera maricola]|uniref:EAL domain-containing protein n=1 Tax=Rheinheimera maricola TaxID=2793282 RepID=A0ABS7XCW3_9GAMM|nr:EAL domain-containing protein [Rheinheimera maricola]MBZ9613390.1 EAL domain-containing protein [Rheinheimera maricola]